MVDFWQQNIRADIFEKRKAQYFYTKQCLYFKANSELLSYEGEWWDCSLGCINYQQALYNVVYCSYS